MNTIPHVLPRTPAADIANVVLAGLTRPRKKLPPWLFYDDEGSRLFEEITTLPEYYVTRAEREILDRHADAIMRQALGLTAARASKPIVVELGAGTAVKTQILLDATVRRYGSCTFMPIDVSRAALAIAVNRIRDELPAVRVDPFVGSYARGLAELKARLDTLGGAELEGALTLLFLGSSIGNFEDEDALELMQAMRGAVPVGTTLILGVDRHKSTDVLIPAYDDARGVTAAFNKNVLARINRELGGHFDLRNFRHVALWNDEASRIEMHLESMCDQRINIDALDIHVSLHRAERIHTESSVKYNDAMLERLFAASGFQRIRSFTDSQTRFGLHVARATGR